MASLVAAFRDITVQSMIARSIAGELSERLNTTVKIKTFFITEKLELCLEDVQINDLNDYPLFMIGVLNAKISPTIFSGEIRIKEIYFKDVLGRIVKYKDDKNLNVTELLAYLGGHKQTEITTDETSAFYMKIDKFKLDNGHVVYWDQHRDRPEKLSMDYFHIDIDSIYSVIDDLEIREDSVMGNVLSLSGKDRCGLPLDNARGNVLFCEKCLNIDNLIIETNESRADLDMRFEYNSSSAYDEFTDSVRIIGNIRPSTLLLSDLKYFSWILRKMPDKFNFTGYFDGIVNDFTVKDFDAFFGDDTHIEADVSFEGVEEFDDAYMDITIKNMVSSYNDVKRLAVPIESKTVPLPEMLEPVGIFNTSCTFQGSIDNFKTNVNFASDMGDILADIYLNTTEDPSYSFDINAYNVNVKSLFDTDDADDVSFALSMHGAGLDVKNTEFEADMNVLSAKLLNNEFNDIKIHGDFENGQFITMADIKHPYLDMNLSALLDLKGNRPSYNIIAKIDTADLVKLNLLDTDTIMLLSTNVNLEFSGDNIDNITGRLNIDNTRYFNGEEYLMKNFSVNVSEISGIKDVTLDCDFFDFYGTGIINASSFVNSMKNTAKQYVNMPEWFENTVPDTKKQEFSFFINLKDSRTLTKLFVPSLYVSSGTTINASYTDGYSYHGSTIESPEIRFNSLKFKNVDIRNTARFDEFESIISFDDVIFSDTIDGNANMIGLENVVLTSRCGHDTVNFDLRWDDDNDENHNKALITSMFVPHENAGGLLTIKSDEIIVNDTLWQINPDCRIDFRKHRTFVNDFDVYSESQRVAVYGVFPKRDIDTLFVEFNSFDISDFDPLTKSFGIDINGTLNGSLGFSGVNENLSFSSDIQLDALSLNGKAVGDVFANAKWYEPKQSVFINTVVYDDSVDNVLHESIGLAGFYYPLKSNNNLNFDVFFNDFKLDVVSPFVRDAIDRLNGFVSGNLSIRGSLDQPVVTGKMNLKNAGCKVDFLNTYYTLNDEIRFERDKIVFDNIVIRDTLGKTATVNGMINHKHFDDFNFDIDLKCDDFIALDIPQEKADGFYGTAVADGTVSIKGTVDDIRMDIQALTKKGTQIDIPLSGTSSVDNNFVVFVGNKAEHDTVADIIVPEDLKKSSNFSMNLDVAVNSDALVNIYLPENMGSINARGNGNINIGLKSDEFELRGDYIITSGAFNFTLEMVRRTFTLRNGGTLHWTGDPADADIDIVGVYRTKSSLTSLGTQAIDSSALTNNINVDCIIRLSDKLMNPSITFGIELPNAKDDTKNLVYSVIDTTNQAIMAQQVFSLMVLGSFSYTAGSNIVRFGTTAGYSVITNRLSSWLSQISKDFDIGINYTPDDKLTNEELEVALSTQLFDDRLIIEGNFGVIRGNKSDANNVNNIVGDVDLTFRLTKRLSLKAYNHTNIKNNNYYYYSFENYSDFTQGIGISFSQSFDNLREVFTIHKKNKNKNNVNPYEPVPK